MRKILFFAFVLAAGMTALTSCKKDKNGADDPSTSSNPLCGTWRYKSDPAPDSGWYCVYTFEFKADGTFSFLDQAFAPGAKDQYDGFITKGSYKIEGDIISLHKEKKGEIHIDGEKYYPEYQPEDEMMKYSLANNKLHLTREYGTDYAWKETYTKVSGDEPEEFDPAELFGTMWRTDSVFNNGEKAPAPHFIVDVIAMNKAIVNGDTISYRIENEKLICDKGTFELLEYKGETAILKDGSLKIYVSKLPAWDYDAMIMEPKTADFVGTWKLAYYTMNAVTFEGSWNTMGTNPGVETWELRADGTATYHNTFSGETQDGSWSYEFGMLMVKNPAQSHLRDEYDRITVQPLTHNWMGFVRGEDTGGSNVTYYQWYFARVK